MKARTIPAVGHAATLVKRYPVTIRWSDEDACFIGTVHALAGDVCHGDDPAAVFQEAGTIALDIVKSRLQRDKALPQPPIDLREAESDPDAKAIRTRLGVTQAQFAGMLGISVTTYLKWEYGNRRPTGPARALLRIAAARPEVIHGLLAAG